MSTVQHTHLGTIDPAAPGFWEATFSYHDRDVVFELTLEKTGLGPEVIENLFRRTDDLESLDGLAVTAIRRDAKDGEDAAAGTYAEHHLQELPDDHLEALFGTTQRDRIAAEMLLSRLHIVRVALFPEETDGPIQIDYSLGEDITNYVLCVTFDRKGKPCAVDFES